MHTVSLKVTADPAKPPVVFSGIPWFAGITVLQAMIVAQAMNPGFSFRAVYSSIYGAFIDQIDTVTDTQTEFWLFDISNSQSVVGVSEAIILEDPSVTNVEIEWVFGVPATTATHRSQVAHKGA